MFGRIDGTVWEVELEFLYHDLSVLSVERDDQCFEAAFPGAVGTVPSDLDR